MKKYGTNLKARPWMMAALLATVITGCSQDSIFGGSQGAGAGNPGPAGTGPSLGAAAAFGGFGGNAGMTNTGTLTVITGAQGQPVSIGTTAVATTTDRIPFNAWLYLYGNGREIAP